MVSLNLKMKLRRIVEHGALFMLVVVGGILGVEKVSGANTSWGASSQPQEVGPIDSSNTNPNAFWASSAAAAKRDGWSSYSDRPATIRAVMDRMYNNDSSYHSLSALVVDHSPLDRPGSVRVVIRQPDFARTAAYDNDTGTGTPSEIYSVDKTQITYYSPVRNVYIATPNHVSPPLPPLASLPLTVGARDFGNTQIDGTAVGGSRGPLVDMLIHPASLLTSTLFADKEVTLDADGSLQGRNAWVLEGVKAPDASSLGALGDRWQMWVDRQTGIVLRLDFYTGNTLIGSAELQQLNIDGSSSPASSTTGDAVATLENWTLPENATQVDFSSYLQNSQ